MSIPRACHIGVAQRKTADALQDVPMVAVRDPDGTEWRVRRRWWPYSDTLDGEDFFLLDWFAVALVLPFLLAWPFWLLAKLFGVRWKIVVERDGAEAHRELVRGGRKAKARINDIALQIAKGDRSGSYTI